MRYAAALTLSLFAAMLAGCTENVIIRPDFTATEAPVCDYTGSTVSDECKSQSLEDHHDYLLGFVEFDDQGWFYDVGQMKRLLARLDVEAARNDLIISVFVHGWKHNAAFCDANVGCFRESLKLLAAQELRHYPAHPRKVVGIYVGWRGLSNDGPALWENLSFYSRKSAATHVALGSVRELFARLAAFQKTQNARTDAVHNTRLMILGHSFGGLIVYTAVAQALIASAATRDQDLVAPFADLVVLVNPAFEASRFEALHRIAANRDYPPGQNPVFVAVTSKTDAATGKAFPIGRWANSMLEKYSSSSTHLAADEKQANTRTIGHDERYHTHSLTLSKAYLPPPLGKPDNAACGCPYANGIRAISDPTYEEERTNLQRFNDTWLDAEFRRKPHWSREYLGGALLTHDEGDPDNAFWVVSADGAIIDGHNDFYTPVFFSFLRELYDDTLRKPPKAK